MSEIRVDTIKNRAGTGSPAFTGNITADGFIISGGGSGFVKADGTVDSNSYISSVNVGDGDVTFAASGNGLSLSSNPTFNLNQSSNKSITFTLSSSTGSVANSICRRDGDANINCRNLNATDVLASDDVIATGAIASKGGSYFYNTSMVNNPLTLTNYYQSRGLGTDVSASFATGINIATASANNNAAALEFYKTRKNGILTGGGVTTQAGDAVMGLVSSADDGTEDCFIGAVYCSVTRQRTLANSSNKGSFYQFVYNADDAYAFDAFTPTREWVTIGEATSTVDSVGPATIRIPWAPSTAASANCGFDGQGRLVRSVSTRAFKSNVEDLDRSYAYNMLSNLKPVWYRSTCNADNPDWSWYGMVAEDVSEVDSRMAIWGYAEDQYDLINEKDVIKKTLKPGAELTPQGVAYDKLAVILWKVVQDQQTAITDLETKVRALESAA